MYVLSNEMYRELLRTFTAARDNALDNRDEESASYYWGLVEYLKTLPRAETLKDFLDVKKLKQIEPPKDDKEEPIKKPSKVPQVGMTLKAVKKWLLNQSDLTNYERFELYYQERELIKQRKAEKDSVSYEDLVKSVTGKKPKN